MSYGPPPRSWAEMREEASEISKAVNTRGRKLDRKFGTGVLPRLIDAGLGEKFRRQLIKYEVASIGADMAEIIKHGSAMLRAYDAIEADAAKRGIEPEVLEQWELLLADGSLILLVKDLADHQRVQTKGRTCEVWSLEEIANIIRQYPELRKTKQAFPGAEVIAFQPKTPVRSDLELSMLDDEIPF